MEVYVVRHKESGDIATIALNSECLAVFKSKEGAKDFLSSPWVVDKKVYAIDTEYYPDIIIEDKRYVKQEKKGLIHYIPFRTYLLERREKVSFLNATLCWAVILNVILLIISLLCFFDK